MKNAAPGQGVERAGLAHVRGEEVQVQQRQEAGVEGESHHPHQREHQNERQRVDEHSDQPIADGHPRLVETRHNAVDQDEEQIGETDERQDPLEDLELRHQPGRERDGRNGGAQYAENVRTADRSGAPALLHQFAIERAWSRRHGPRWYRLSRHGQGGGHQSLDAPDRDREMMRDAPKLTIRVKMKRASPAAMSAEISNGDDSL